jgi:carbon storage regulator
MLILTRREGETIQINENIRVKILGQKNGQVKVGIEAPRNVSIVREEILRRQPASHLP